ncbi:hypothetical protein CR513_37034, partial [Mucuna pruriens]
MVNEVGEIDNLRLENELIELTSLVRQLAIGKHQPSIVVRVCGIHTSMEHPTNVCPTLQEIESDHPESVGSIVGHMIVNNLEDNNTGLVRVKGNILLKNLDLPKACLRLSAEFEIPSTIIPTTATTKSAIIGQLTIFRGPDEAVSDKKPRVLAYNELQQHAILAKFKCHNPRPQNAGGSASKHCESTTIGWTILNPRGNTSVVSLRSGKELPQQATLQQRPRPVDAKSVSDVDSPARIVSLPFQTRTLSARKVETDEDLLKMFQKVEINIPLLNAIKQILKYAKILKELCMHKRKKMKGGVEFGGVVSALTKNEVAA